MGKIYFILFLLSLLPCLVCQEKKKEYSLVWSDLQGFECISTQNTTIINERFEVQKDKPKLLRTQKIHLQCKVYHTIVASEGDFVVVRILHREGKIRLDAERTMLCEVDTPEKVKNASKYPDIEPYISSITGGFVYRVNKITGEVIGTWQMVEEEQKIDPKTKKQDVKYKMVPIGKDPLGNSSAFHLIPNKSVPVGYEWNRRQMGTQTEDLKFAQVVSHNNRKAVAKITRKGTLMQNEAKVGTTEGTLYFDLEYKTTLEHISKTIYEQTMTLEEKNKKRNILEKITSETKIALLYTNYDLIPKKKP